jgi:peptide/nickel transport system substrate-binding protein
VASAAASTAGGPTGERAQTLIIGTPLQSEGRWDPAVGFEDIYRIVLKSTYDTLITFKGNDLSKFVSSAATEWTSSSDAKTYTFKLNPAAVFNSGNPLTSADVKFSYQRLLNLAGPPSGLPANIDSIGTPDPQTVTITLKNPDVTFLTQLTQENFAILDSKVAIANGATDATDAKDKDKASAYLENHTLGSGPYQMKEYVVGEKLVLEQNPKSWRPAPYFKTIIFQNVDGAEAQIAAVKRGDIDITRELSPRAIAPLKSDPTLQLVGSPGFIWYLFGMTRKATVDEAVSKPQVQEAIHLALDYAGLKALAPELQQWYGMNPPYVPGGVLESEAPQQNIDKAKSLLAAAGYPNGFKTEICTSSATGTQPSMLDFAQKIQADLKKVGIDATIDAQENTAFLTKYRAGAKGATEGCHLVQTITGPPIPDPAQIQDFLPGGYYGLRLGWNKDNLGPDGAEYVQLKDQALKEVDPAKRAAIWHQIAVKLNVNGPWISEATTQFQSAATVSITGFEGSNDIFLFDPYSLKRS